MKRWHLISWVLWASLFGLFVALLRGSDLVVSIELWLAGFATWLAGIVIVQTLRVLPLGSLAASSTGRAHRAGRDQRPVELRRLEMLVRQANRNPRAFTTQLQPRLIALADHYLPLHHGLDRQEQPEMVRAILGRTSMLLEPAEDLSAPTLEDLDDFVAALTDDRAADRGWPLDSGGNQ